MADDANHSRQRRTLAHAFSQKAVLEQESILRGYVDLFVERLTPFAASGERVNLCDWLSMAPIFLYINLYKTPANGRLYDI